MGNVKMFGQEFSWKKAEPDPEVVDENGKVVNKKTFADHVIGVGKTVVKIGVIAGTAAIAYTVGGKKVGKEKDQEISEINKDLLNLYSENAELQAKLRDEESDEKEEEQDEVEITTF